MRVRAARNLALALAVLIASVALVAGQAASDPTVYITKTGAKYHRDGCSSLSRSRIPIKLSLAATTYGACKNCRPPVPEVAPAAEATGPRRESQGPERARALGALPGDDEEGHTVSS